MGYRLIKPGKKYKAELWREMDGERKGEKREMRRQRKCVEGGERSNRMGGRGEDMRWRVRPPNEIM